MGNDDASGGSPIFHAVCETLDAVVAPVVREALIHDALELAGLRSVPASGPAMRLFARGALREVTRRALGAELAESVIDEILRTIRRTPAPWSEPPGVVRSGPAPRNRPSNPLLRRSLSPAPSRRATLAGPGSPSSPPPGFTPAPRRRSSSPPQAGVVASAWPAGLTSHLRRNLPTGEMAAAAVPSAPRVPFGVSAAAPAVPLVIVATAEAALSQALTEWFDHRARVCRVDTPVELVRHLDAADGRRAVIVLDGRCPSIRPAALAVLLEEFPHVDVVLCRAAAATEEVVLSASPSTARWLVYREPASLDHVAAECLRLVS